MDGTHRIVVLQRNDSQFTVIVLLHKRGEICWIEINSERNKQISCFGLEGKKQRTVYDVNEHFGPYTFDGFVASGDRFYWCRYEYVLFKILNLLVLFLAKK